MLKLVKDLGTLYPTKTSKHKFRYGVYKCYCGVEFKAQVQNVKNKSTTSCGCYQKQRSTESHIIHGLRHHRLYRTWADMIRRCNNKNSKSYKDYGARGITVCERWHNVANFIEDMYPTYQEGLSIDRVNNDKGYFLDNCRWVTQSIQSRNTRKIWSHNTSGYRGVHFNKSNNKWISKISINNRTIYLGCFIDKMEAAKAYDKYIIDNKLEHTINGVIKI